MSQLKDEPLEKVADTKDMIEAFDGNEAVGGIVQCNGNGCDYWGQMEGVIEHNDRAFIKFICPKCRTIERVKNPEHIR